MTSLPHKRMKYILLWNNHYLFLNEKNESIFPSLNCSVKSCFFTNDKKMLGDYTKFNAVVFSEKILKSKDRPKERKPSQLFVFTTQESSYNYAACELYNDNFFNWTFTYRLDSDILWNYFVVRDASGEIVAPSADVEWDESSRPLKPKLKSILHRKRKAAAWIVSNCFADSLRDDYLMVLQYHLSHFSLKIDVYGHCSKVDCTNNDCNDMLTQNYHFFMAFENSLSEDYVTEKVLHGYLNYAVPVVYGGANYTRFLPRGSYINAREMHPYNLAFAIYEATQKPSVFESYFEWTNLYTIHALGNTYHPLCELED
ncbi:hypothetical protein MSG28_012383 [Choristoneura fumiferana]|uniref:Uncharacterized protein n=1 Tax=Choristoneura fumiferana TaxID=7141 RepID=A0ACC0KDL2_CHOFU|nr:hypothetical protein MSG28_012383 [Choristoneura fumiferana]